MPEHASLGFRRGRVPHRLWQGFNLSEQTTCDVRGILRVEKHGHLGGAEAGAIQHVVIAFFLCLLHHHLADLCKDLPHSLYHSFVNGLRAAALKLHPLPFYGQSLLLARLPFLEQSLFFNSFTVGSSSCFRKAFSSRSNSRTRAPRSLLSFCKRARSPFNSLSATWVNGCFLKSTCMSTVAIFGAAVCPPQGDSPNAAPRRRTERINLRLIHPPTNSDGEIPR
jgi:hypothetical protein